MNEELEEQASLYVFGLLDRAEAAAFERRLESDDEMRALVDKLDEAAAAIAHNAPARTLPPQLRARVLSQVGDANKIVVFPRRSAWMPWTLAACLALTCAYLVAENSRLRKRVTRLEEPRHPCPAPDCLAHLKARERAECECRRRLGREKAARYFESHAAPA